jgi:hypothetical protein
MKPQNIEAMLAEIREERAELTQQLQQLDAALHWLESKLPKDATPIAAAERNESAEKPARAQREKPKRDTKEEYRKRKAPAAHPLTDEIMQCIINAIGRTGRLLYPDQLAEELLRDGIEYGDDLVRYLREMWKQEIVVKVRYNGVNIQMAYGLRDWRTNLDAHHARGKNTDPSTAEIFSNG